MIWFLSLVAISFLMGVAILLLLDGPAQDRNDTGPRVFRPRLLPPMGPGIFGPPNAPAGASICLDDF